MPLVQPSPLIKYQFFTASGIPLAFGKVYTFIAGSNTPLDTYVDHFGIVKNTNPIILDAGGYADIWLTATAYKISVHDANDVPLYTIDGIPGIGSLISVGDLPPLFTTTFAAGALSFNLSNAAAGTLFGRFAGTTGAPSYGAVGTTHQITMNQGGQMVGSDNLLYDPATRTFSLRDTAADIIRLKAGAAGGQGTIIFGTGTSPSITQVTDWQYSSLVDQDISFGPATSLHSFIVAGGTGGTSGLAVGNVKLGEGAAPGVVNLNNGNNGAGVFAGVRIIAGSVADPNTVVSAPTGSLFLTTNGGANTTLWIKEASPTASTGWVAK